jgi:hypothetical protein
MTNRKAEDGASKRRLRMLDLIGYIHNYPRDTKGPCTLRACQTFMLLRHGNKRDTVLDYLRELEEVDVIVLNRKTGNYHLKRSFDETLALFAAAGDDWSDED